MTQATMDAQGTNGQGSAPTPVLRSDFAILKVGPSPFLALKRLLARGFTLLRKRTIITHNVRSVPINVKMRRNKDIWLLL